MKPIYKPKGRAGEYGDYAINTYTGCNHGCTYCYAAKMARRYGRDFAEVRLRDGIVEATNRQLERSDMKGNTIHLCFTCDPYPAEIDTSATREIIKAIKESGNHVQILTKGGERAERDFDLLDNGDWFGITYSGFEPGFSFTHTEAEPYAAPWSERLASLARAKKLGINTWISCEPVLVPEDIIQLIELADYVDLFKIGKLNYERSDINWRDFGHRVERACIVNHRNYMIKEDLRREMAIVSSEA